MTNEELLRMAQEAGIKGPLPARQGFRMSASPDRLRRFAALVAAAERNKLAAWMIKHSYATGHGDTTEDLLKELEWQIEERIRNEREACARIIEDYHIPVGNSPSGELAFEWTYCALREIREDIRARGNA